MVSVHPWPTAMFEFLGRLPALTGSLVAMAMTVVVGLGVYVGSSRIISRSQSEDLKDGAGNLFRVVGILVALLLSLAFGQVIAEWRAIEDAVDREAVAIGDLLSGLRLYDVEVTREIRINLIDYTHTIVEDDWPAMADNELSFRGYALKKRISSAILALTPTNERQVELKPRLLDDVDSLSDYRLIRLNHAQGQTPVYLPVVVFGFVVSIVCFGSYRPTTGLLMLVTLYAAFFGLALYLVVSLSDPFTGGNAIEPTTFERLLDWMQESEK